MAIVVQEEKKNNTDLSAVVTWVVILAVVALSAYYLFFKRPELIDIVTPTNFEDVEELASFELDPDRIVNSPEFQALMLRVTPLFPTTPGRANPFKL